ncbi:MAG: response regulator [Deltaproteobacteria bacterium]|nr:response regulator [Deltaproteobacteria bacterium]
MPSTPPRSSRDASTPRPPLVLVADDFEDTRIIYAESLRYAGFRVAEAANGKDAVEIAKRLSPDVVVMDLAMPVMDGWEATRRLKSDPQTSGIRIMAVTAHDEGAHRLLAWRAGCDDFFPKPVLPQVLISRIKHCLGAA